MTTAQPTITQETLDEFTKFFNRIEDTKLMMQRRCANPLDQNTCMTITVERERLTSIISPNMIQNFFILVKKFFFEQNEITIKSTMGLEDEVIVVSAPEPHQTRGPPMKKGRRKQDDTATLKKSRREEVHQYCGIIQHLNILDSMSSEQSECSVICIPLLYFLDEDAEDDNLTTLEMKFAGVNMILLKDVQTYYDYKTNNQHGLHNNPFTNLNRGIISAGDPKKEHDVTSTFVTSPTSGWRAGSCLVCLVYEKKPSPDKQSIGIRITVKNK